MARGGYIALALLGQITLVLGDHFEWFFQYKHQIDFLKDATNFEVNHFIVNDIIGFNITAGNEEKFVRLNNRVQATYASMPKTSSFIHYGKIK